MVYKECKMVHTRKDKYDKHTASCTSQSNELPSMVLISNEANQASPNIVSDEQVASCSSKADDLLAVDNTDEIVDSNINE